MDPEDRKQLCEATALACDWHGEQTRKGSQIPYVSHLLQVSGLVLEHEGDCSQAVAALLHDSLEDAEDPDERERREALIRERFGEDVLRIVLDCTDTKPDEAGASKRPWKERKTRYLAHLTAVRERSALVAACDKRHNLHALVWDVSVRGLGYLDRFNAGPADQVWYFDGVLAAFRGRIPVRLEREIEDLLGRLRVLLEASPSTSRRGADHPGS